MVTALGKGLVSGVLAADQLSRQRATDSRNDLLLGMQLQSSVAETQRKTEKLRQDRQFSQEQSDAFTTIFTEVDQGGNRVLKNLSDDDGLKASMEFTYNQIASGLRNNQFTKEQIDTAFSTVDGLKKQGLDKLVQRLILNPNDETNRTKLTNKLNLPKGTSFNVRFGGGVDSPAGGNQFTPKFTAMIPKANGPMDERDITPFFQAVAIQSISNIIKSQGDELDLQKKAVDITNVIESTNKVMAEKDEIPLDALTDRAFKGSKTQKNIAQTEVLRDPDPENFVTIESSIGLLGKEPKMMSSSPRITQSLRGFGISQGLTKVNAERFVAEVTNEMMLETKRLLEIASKQQSNYEEGMDIKDVFGSLKYIETENRIMEKLLERKLKDPVIANKIKSILQGQKIKGTIVNQQLMQQSDP